MDLQTLSPALTPPRANFLSLPLELRNEIYRHLLSTRRTRIDLGLGRARYNLPNRNPSHEPANPRRSQQSVAREPLHQHHHAMDDLQTGRPRAMQIPHNRRAQGQGPIQGLPSARGTGFHGRRE